MSTDTWTDLYSICHLTSADMLTAASAYLPNDTIYTVHTPTSASTSTVILTAFIVYNSFQLLSLLHFYW